jgi:hypothetical protein
VIAVGAVWFFCVRESEPSYNGRTFRGKIAKDEHRTFNVQHRTLNGKKSKIEDRRSKTLVCVCDVIQSGELIVAVKRNEFRAPEGVLWLERRGLN